MISLSEKSNIFVDGLDHPECVIVHSDGSLWAGGEAGQIYKITENGKKTEEVLNTRGFVLGLAFSPGCDWLAICDLKNHCVWKYILQSNELIKLSDGLVGHSFNIPNYPAFDNAGNLFVTESGEFREISGKIIKFNPDGSGSIWHNGPFNFANGMAFDKSQENIFVVSSWLPGVESIAINLDGSPGERMTYCKLPETVPDGIAFDLEGNLLISCYTPNRIYIVSPDKKIDIFADDWEAHTLSNPTNISFGGSSFDKLYVSNLGRWHILEIDYGKKGLRLSSHRSMK